MGRRATGSIVTTPGEHGTAFAARFMAYGQRRYVTLGSSSDGWDHSRAADELANILADVRRGTWQPPSRELAAAPSEEPTFHQFASEWFEAKRHEIRESTAERYLIDLSCFLLPYFRHHRLSQITVAEVDAYRQAMVRERDWIAAERAKEKTKRRPASNETINKTITRLAQILDVAEERELIPRNPVRVNPRNRRLKTSKPQRSYLDSARQIAALLDAAGELDREARVDRRHLARRTMFAGLVLAGLRLGELLALRWQDVDLADGWLSIGRSKTDAGTRKVKIRPALRDALSELKAGAGNARPNALVFPTSKNRPHSQSNVRRTMALVAARADERLAEAEQAPLPKISPHSLRRTFASVMFALGESIPGVMADGGWADPKIVLVVYAHSMRRDDAENERLRELVEGAVLAEKGRNEAESRSDDIPTAFPRNAETRF